MIDAKTIQIFLPGGEPRGLRIAEITTRIVQAVQVPRTKLGDFYNRPEAERVALYFLFGPPGDGAKPVVYIGQTEDLRTRFKLHNSNKDFWTAAVAITSRTESFTQVHARYLEWHSIDQAKQAGRYELDNGNAGGRPHIPEPLEADVLDAFDTASTLLSTLGFPVFEPPAGTSKEQEKRDVFYCKGPLADGRGSLVEDGFVVFKGSLCRRERTPSSTVFIKRLDELIDSKALIPHGDEQLVVTEDLVVKSPSFAACMVLARNANGWNEWKLPDGRTLDEMYRSADSGE